MKSTASIRSPKIFWPIVRIVRLEKSTDGVLGTLSIEGKIFCSTLEPEDKDNKQNVSCIPAGTYNITSWESPKFGHVYKVLNVPDRTDILFHAGNTEDATRGCILLGQYPSKLRKKRAVMNSGDTLAKFVTYMLQRDGVLIIEECYEKYKI